MDEGTNEHTLKQGWSYLPRAARDVNSINLSMSAVYWYDPTVLSGPFYTPSGTSAYSTHTHTHIHTHLHTPTLTHVQRHRYAHTHSQWV